MTRGFSSLLAGAGPHPDQGSSSGHAPAQGQQGQQQAGGPAAGAPAAQPRAGPPLQAPSPLHPGSFTDAVAVSQKDWHALALFGTVLLLVTCQSRGFQPLELALTWATVAVLAALGAWQLAAPASYGCRRWATVPLARLAMVGRLLAVDTMRTFGPAPAPASPAAGSFAPLEPHVLLAFLMSSGVCALGTSALGMQLPPLAAVLVQVAAAAAAAATNARSCASFAQLPLSERAIGAAYRWLRPAALPLERLQLLSAGMGPDLSQQQCTSVLAALQFWLGLLLPTMLVVRSQCKAYVAWRRERGLPPIEQEHIVPASGGSSTGGGAHPEDWQYEGAVRTLRALSAAQCGLVLAALLDFYWTSHASAG